MQFQLQTTMDSCPCTVQVGQLMNRLPVEDVQRLRTFALCLACRQYQLRIFLPSSLTQHILSLIDS